MANSFVRYTGDNSTTSYSIPFSYRATSDLTVTLSGVVTTAYTLNSAGTTLTFNTVPAQDVAIEIRRRTSQGTKLVDYASGSVLTENDLDTDSDQAFFMSQEAIDDAGDVIKVSNVNFQWDVQNKRLTNVADPVDNTDVVNKQFISANLPNITTVSGISADVTAVAGISANVTAVANDATDIGTVATNMPSITTVATNINDVIKVADDLNEAISEVETVANDLNEATSEIEVVANNIVNVNTVGTINADVTTVANNETDIQTLADLEDGTVTTNGLSTLAGLNTEIQGVYNIRTNVTNVDTNSANVNLVAGQISPTNNVSAVSAVATQIGTLGALGTEITNLNNIKTDITGVNNIAPAVTAVNNNSVNINTVAGLDTEITALGASGTVASINTVASNLISVNSFAERYRVQAGVPASSNDVGDLVFDTTAGKLKVFDGSSYALAGSSVNGTNSRHRFTATAGQTTFTGADLDGNTLSYDVAGGVAFIDVYLNGVHLDSSDYTATSGSSIVLSSGATVGDEIYITAFGTFTLASFSAGNITSGTINNDRLPSPVLTVKGDGSSTDGAIQLNCSQNSHGVKIKSPAHSAGQSYTLILPTSVGTANQVLATNGNSTNQLSWIDATETKPTVANVSQTIAPATATTISITGTNFVSIPIVEFIKTDGSVTLANTVAFTNATTLSVNVTLASGNYYVRIENPDGNAGRSTQNIITASTAPTFSTNAGSLGTIAGNFSGTVATIAGSSDSAVTFSEVGSNLSSANVTLASNGVLSTTDFGGSSTTATLYNFTIRITDAEGQTVDRDFSLQSSFGATGGGQFN